MNEIQPGRTARFTLFPFKIRGFMMFAFKITTPGGFINPFKSNTSKPRRRGLASSQNADGIPFAEFLPRREKLSESRLRRVAKDGEKSAFTEESVLAENRHYTATVQLWNSTLGNFNIPSEGFLTQKTALVPKTKVGRPRKRAFAFSGFSQHLRNIR